MSAGAVVTHLDERRPQHHDARALLHVVAAAHAAMDARPKQYMLRHEIDRSDILPWEKFARTPPRTSIYGHPL